jgi:armadillo repeat-containing protein 8
MFSDFTNTPQELLLSGAIKVLSGHARSAEPRLRISALWALKNMVIQAPFDIDKEVFEELGSGFIFQLLTGESSSTNGSGSKSGKHLATANAYGERVDLLNDDDEPSMDIDSNHEAEYDDGELAIEDEESDDSLYRSDSNPSKRLLRSRFGPSRVYASRLKALLANEKTPSHLAKSTELRIQHHALDILRNITGNPNAQQPELIDMILNQMGTSRFIDYLVGRIRPQTRLDPETGEFLDGGKDTAERAVVENIINTRFGLPKSRSEFLSAEHYAHPDVVECAVYSLVHISNGNPPHRELVMSAHPKIISYISRLLSHPDHRIRTGILWLIHNLLWVDGPEDYAAAHVRATELRKQGLDEGIRASLNDRNLDTRERAKAALEQFQVLLEGQTEWGRRRLQSIDAIP